MPDQNCCPEGIALGHCCLVSSLFDNSRRLPGSRSSPFCRTSPSGRVYSALAEQGVLAPSACRRMLESTNPLFFRNVKGSLMVEEQRLTLKPYYYSGSMVPTIIAWKSPSTFFIKVGRTEFELTFSTSEDAAKAVVLVKTNFPEVQETWRASP